MGTKGRDSRVDIYDGMYRDRGVKGIDPCVYCGQISDTVDHVPPLVMVEMIASVGMQIDRTYVRLPACMECNLILNRTGILKISERRQIVKKKLKVRYKHYLKIPAWDEEELEEMSPEFAEEIRASVAFAAAIRRRLAWR